MMVIECDGISIPACRCRELLTMRFFESEESFEVGAEGKSHHGLPSLPLSDCPDFNGRQKIQA